MRSIPPRSIRQTRFHVEICYGEIAISRIAFLSGSPAKENLMTRKVPILALAALALSACTALRMIHSAKLKAPQVSFVSYRFIGADASQANLEFTLAAYNPNTIGLRNVNIGYELFHQDRRFLHGGDIAV